jgi:hypothetical protein
MKLYQCLLIKNRWYKSGQTIPIKGIVVHSSGANNSNLKRYVQPASGQGTGMGMVVPETKKFSKYEMLQFLGTNKYSNDWNRDDQPYGMHAFVGKLADGTVAAVQTLPWASFLWGCGSGKNGSYNSSHIQFEICEDTTDPEYTKKAFKVAAELCAHLCKGYNLPVEAIVSHNEAGRTGYGSKHVDPEHWWSRYGYTMAGFREEVQKLISAGETEKSEPEKNEIAPEKNETAPEQKIPEPEKKNSKPEKVVIAKAKCKNSCYRKTFTVASPDGELNMRADSGATQPLIKTLKNGDTVTCYGYFTVNGSAIWLYVIDKSGQEGFVNKKYLK